MTEREKHDLGGFASSSGDKREPAGDSAGNPASGAADESGKPTGKQRDDEQEDDDRDGRVDLAVLSRDFAQGTERDELVAGKPTSTSPRQPAGTSPEQPVSASPEQPVGTTPGQPVGTTPDLPVGTSPEQPVGTTPEQAEYDRRHGGATDGYDPIFAEADVKDIRERWHDIQVGFVDDPAGAVQRARDLNDEMVTSLAAALDARKRELEQSTANGDTEGLRQALRHYRHILDRISAL
jgi:hypothetical protein